MPEPIILRNTQSPGDILMLTALPRDIHRCYPGQFIVGVDTSIKDPWRHNPYIAPLKKTNNNTMVMHYPMVHTSNQARLHFLQGFITFFNEQKKKGVVLTEPKPDLHLTEEEKTQRMIEEPYWVIASGGKYDFTAKWWDPARWQQVVNMLKGKVKFVQVGAKKDHHPPLFGVIDMRGKTNIRQLMGLVYHSEGVCCVVTCLMHFAAAFDKPCVVVSGGREPWWWEAYVDQGYGFGGMKIPVPHVFLHSLGRLKCCRNHGCWKNKIIAKKEGQSVCQHPVEQKDGTIIPKCLDIITAQDVVDGVNAYSIGDLSKVHDLNEAQMNAPLISAAPKQEDIEQPGQPEAKLPAPPVPEGFEAQMFDTEQFGGKLTICTLLYGEFHQMHRRNVESIINNTPDNRYHLKIGCNEVCDETWKWIEQEVIPRVNPDVYVSDENIRKYPMMRHMFHDPDSPLMTKWTVWFDDDSWVTADTWLHDLAAQINQNYPKVRSFGHRFFIHLKNGQKEWIEGAEWYRNRDLRFDKRAGKEAVDFLTGGFWAIETECIKQLNWPDPRIGHNGGDVMLGAAMYQQQWRDKVHHKGINISDAKRRGANEKPAGTK